MAKEKTIKVRTLIAILVGFFVLVISASMWLYIVSLMTLMEKYMTFNQQGLVAVFLALQMIINFVFSIFFMVIIWKDV